MGSPVHYVPAKFLFKSNRAMGKRSSMTLLQRLRTAVIHHPHLDGRRIHYKTSGSTVKIEGKAKTYYEKQMAQELLRNIEGVGEIQNNVIVCS